MDFDDAWAGPTEKLEDKEKKELSLNPRQGVHPSSPKSLPSLKKIQLLPLANELPASLLPTFEFVSTLLPVTTIKPPPTIFTDLWGDSDDTFSVPDEVPQTSMLNPNQTVDENQVMFVPEDTLFVSEEKSKATIPPELDSMLDGLWENEVSSSDEANEDWAEHATTSFDNLNIFEDLDLFDIDAALAKQEADVQQQEYEREREVAVKESRFERWGGVSSLIYVNWDNKETAERDALERLGYANVPLSKETRAFIIQAARNARLPHKQEVQLTTQLANARAQLALLPSYNDEEPIDPHVARRRALQAEITEIEQTLTAKMQWVAIKKAVQFLGQGIELDDLIQFGMLGVIAGIKHFDITRKARLLFAVNAWTFQALTRAIGDYGSAIRLPTYVFEQIKTLKKQHFQWQLSYGRLPTRQELAKTMDISYKDLLTILKAEEILSSSKKALPIEHFIHAEHTNEGYSFQESELDLIMGDDTSTDILGEINGQQIQHILFQHLTSREQHVFSLRAGLAEDGDGEGYTLEEIGRLLKITRERVRQIEERARRKLTPHLRKSFPALSVRQKTENSAEVVPDDKSVHQKTGKMKTIPYTKVKVKRYLNEKSVKNTNLGKRDEIARGAKLRREYEEMIQKRGEITRG